MMFACEVGRTGKQPLTNTQASLMRRDNQRSYPANHRAIRKMADEFSNHQADDLVCRFGDQNAAGVAW
jgi:hypothetical protein